MPWGECKGEILIAQFRLYSADVWQPARCWHTNETTPFTLKAAICKIIIVIMRMMITDIYIVIFKQTALSSEQTVQTATLVLTIWSAATSGVGSGHLSKQPQKNTKHQAGLSRSLFNVVHHFYSASWFRIMWACQIWYEYDRGGRQGAAKYYMNFPCFHNSVFTVMNIRKQNYHVNPVITQSLKNSFKLQCMHTYIEKNQLSNY